MSSLTLKMLWETTDKNHKTHLLQVWTNYPHQGPGILWKLVFNLHYPHIKHTRWILVPRGYMCWNLALSKGFFFPYNAHFHRIQHNQKRLWLWVTMRHCKMLYRDVWINLAPLRRFGLDISILGSMMKNKCISGSRWAVTGSPCNNGVRELFGIMSFLKYKPFSERHWWQCAVERPINHDAPEGDSILVEYQGFRNV